LASAPKLAPEADALPLKRGRCRSRDGGLRGFAHDGMKFPADAHSIDDA